MTDSDSRPTLYKVLDTDGSAYHGGSGQWFLPRGKKPGEWMPPIEGNLVPCRNGYHLCREGDLIKWLGPVIYEAEYRGEMVESADKLVVRQARLARRVDTWTERTARLFAADCAEHVLPLFEQDYPTDTRPREAIAVARRYANGEATPEELAAAREAAGAAARAAAREAAWAAAREAAWAAAWAAGWAAAELAARAAAWAAARAAERAWQTERLMAYLNGEI